MERKMTAVAWDFMQDRTGIYPLVRAMGEIAGTTSILVAGEYLSHPEYGDGSMMGGMTGVAPSEVVIIGAGTVGEFAARAAITLGASVRDSSPYRLRRLRGEIGGRLWTSTLHPKVLAESLAAAMWPSGPCAPPRPDAHDRHRVHGAGHAGRLGHRGRQHRQRRLLRPPAHQPPGSGLHRVRGHALRCGQHSKPRALTASMACQPARPPAPEGGRTRRHRVGCEQQPHDPQRTLPLPGQRRQPRPR